LQVYSNLALVFFLKDFLLSQNSTLDF